MEELLQMKAEIVQFAAAGLQLAVVLALAATGSHTETGLHGTIQADEDNTHSRTCIFHSTLAFNY
jgi:hypothetical protein